jgi:5'-nucleotidase
MATDRTGREVPIVTTSGEYRYVGRLTAGFDRRGNLIYIDESRSGPVRVATGTCNGTLPCDDAVTPDQEMLDLVVDPVVAGLEDLAAEVIATSEVALDGTRASVRTVETNQGNLLADALLWAATQEAPTYGAPAPDVAIQNSGGIRNNTIIAAGNITALDTFDIAPFPNFVSIVPDISREQFKEILENTVACTQPTDATNNSNCGTGRFPQIGGFMFEWSAAGDALIMDLDLNVLQAGTRVRHVELTDGTVIVENGVVVPGDPIVMTTNDFSARGGDQYPFRGLPFINVGSTYQQALENYIKTGLSGQITAAQYPEGGEGRIVPLP